MKKIFLNIKKYWFYFTSFAVFVLGFLFFRKKTSSLVDQISEINERHSKEIERINEIRLKERELLKKNEEILRKTLAEITVKYEEAQRELTKKKKEEIEKIVKEYGSDPDELAIQLSNVTGFKIVYPERNFNHEE
jgi:hypothetical protein